MLIFCIILSMVMPTAIIAPSFAEGSNAYYVSEKGSDQNSGTEESPFRTVAKGLQAANSGDTVYLRNGVYNEAIVLPKSGDPKTGAITLTAFPGERPILDGSGLNSADMINIDTKHDWVIEGLEIRNLSRLNAHGISIEGASENITLSKNKIYNINTTGAVGKKMTGGANAILVKSLSEDEISNIHILDNEIFDCTVGYSEALTISGNVNGFVVSGNKIHDITNIGIDIAGHYEADYQSRNGVISNNTVENCHSAYGSGDASGIYIDGGKGIKVIGNTVKSNDYGITVGCENSGKTASDIALNDNLVSENDKSGLAIGGWSETAGRVTGVTVTQNEISMNNVLASPFHGELTLSNGSDYQISDNLIQSRQAKAPDFNALKGIYPMIYNIFKVDQLVLENNRYFSKGSLRDLYFRIDDEAYVGFENYRLGTQLDLDSVYTDPVYAQNPSRYTIDGDSKEWLSYTPLYLNRLLPSDSLRINNDKKALYIFLSQSMANKNNAFYIDVDASIKTGYQTHLWKTIGADYLIENGRLYKYSGSGSDWKFSYITTLKDYVLKQKCIEMKIPLSHLNITSSSRILLGFTSKETTNTFIPLKNQPSLMYKMK